MNAPSIAECPRAICCGTCCISLACKLRPSGCPRGALLAVAPEAGCGLLSLRLAAPVYLGLVARATAVEDGRVGTHGCEKESNCGGSDGLVEVLLESCGRCLLLSGLVEWC
jgi:hypothetical protein